MTRETDLALQEEMISLIRGFGLHRPEQTPCGQPVAIGEAHALLELSRSEPLSQTQLSERLRLEKSTVSRLVGLLLTRGWVERERSASDGRVLQLRLSAAGRDAAAGLAAARRRKFAALLAAIPAEKRASVIDALHVLVEALNESH